MMRHVWIVLLVACAHRSPSLFGERPPKGCDGPSLEKAKEDDPTTSKCVAWIAERLQSEMYAREYQDAAIKRYVDGVGKRIVRAAGTKEPITFRVMDDPDPQAEAWVGGTVRVTRGALARLRSEAELAALLAHEVGHLLAGHNDGKNRNPRDARDDEIQADEIAVRLTARAGYDPTAVGVMLRALAAGSQTTCDDTKRIHPCLTERLARIEALVGDRRGGEVAPDRYRRAVAHLVIGSIDPLRVSALGGALVFGHAKLAFGPPDAGELATTDGYGGIKVDEDVVVVVPISIAFARSMRAKGLDGSAFYIGARGALLIIVGDGDAATRRAAQLVRWVRAPHPDELAMLHPIFYDATSPRRLWPN